MEGLDCNLQMSIASYCEPRSLSCLCQVSHNICTRLQRTLAICLPRALAHALEVSTSLEILRDDMEMVRTILQKEHAWITCLWLCISDNLCQQVTSPHRGAFRRPAAGLIPTHLSFDAARQVHTWRMASPEVLRSHSRCRLLQHEVYRIDRLRLKVWKKHAPLAIALIY